MPHLHQPSLLDRLQVSERDPLLQGSAPMATPEASDGNGASSPARQAQQQRNARFAHAMQELSAVQAAVAERERRARRAWNDEEPALQVRVLACLP